MLDGLRWKSVLFIPRGCPCVQGLYLPVPVELQEPAVQQIGEQMMVAIPLPLLVERDDEQIGSLQIL
jgi:hypothetical protein